MLSAQKVAHFQIRTIQNTPSAVLGFTKLWISAISIKVLLKLKFSFLFFLRIMVSFSSYACLVLQFYSPYWTTPSSAYNHFLSPHFHKLFFYFIPNVLVIKVISNVIELISSMHSHMLLGAVQ